MTNNTSIDGFKMPITIETDEFGQYVVSSGEYDAYGVGDTLTEALEDFGQALVDMRELLANYDRPLNTELAERLQRLNALLVVTP